MITVPLQVWELMLEQFAREKRRVEQVCYLDGVATGGGGVVTTLTFPNAVLTAGWFEVSPGAMSQAGKHMRAHGLRRLAQVHTHPSDWVGHSPWDDQHAYSHRIGALSIVLPRYGRNSPSLAQVGIHIRTADGWQQIELAFVDKYIRIVPSCCDFRAPFEEVQHDRSRIEPTRRKPWGALRAFFRLSERRDHG